MRISFDLDDTLICYGTETPAEPRPRWYWRMFVSEEPLRHGTPTLMRSLVAQGCELWIYTTSQRRPAAVKRWLWAYGISVRQVINQNVHNRVLRRRPHDNPPSKNPAAFGIDLHIDDSDGVRMEGERYGFRVIVVDPDDVDWTTRVLAAVQQMQSRASCDRHAGCFTNKMTPNVDRQPNLREADARRRPSAGS